MADQFLHFTGKRGREQIGDGVAAEMDRCGSDAMHGVFKRARSDSWGPAPWGENLPPNGAGAPLASLPEGAGPAGAGGAAYSCMASAAAAWALAQQAAGGAAAAEGGGAGWTSPLSVDGDPSAGAHGLPGAAASAADAAAALLLQQTAAAAALGGAMGPGGGDLRNFNAFLKMLHFERLQRAGDFQQPHPHPQQQPLHHHHALDAAAVHAQHAHTHAQHLQRQQQQHEEQQRLLHHEQQRQQQLAQQHAHAAGHALAPTALSGGAAPAPPGAPY